jgi:hypothetical protein
MRALAISVTPAASKNQTVGECIPEKTLSAFQYTRNRVQGQDSGAVSLTALATHHNRLVHPQTCGPKYLDIVSKFVACH